MKKELRSEPKSPPMGTQKVSSPSAVEYFISMLKIFMTA